MPVSQADIRGVRLNPELAAGPVSKIFVPLLPH